MKKCNLLFLIIISVSSLSYGQQSMENSTEQQLKELKKDIKELNELYMSLQSSIESTKGETNSGIQSVNTKFEAFLERAHTSYSKIDNRTESIEKSLHISDSERKKNFALSIDRNQDIQENFSQYIKFYGDKYSQLDEKVTSEELALELRRIINPQSGSLGFKLSDTLQHVLTSNYKALVDEIMINSDSKKNDMKDKIDGASKVVTSIMDNQLMNDVVGMIPYGSNIKNLVGTLSGLVINLFDKKHIKKEYQDQLVQKIIACQNNVFKDLKPIILFYDNMAKLDNEYQITLQTIRNDVDILGIELKEFSFALEAPIKKVDPVFSLNKNNNIREITIQLAEEFEKLKNDEKTNRDHLFIMTNMSLEIKNRSRDLYNRYREIQESKINANNKFVDKFEQVVKMSNIASNTDALVLKLSQKNKTLIEKMNVNHAIDKLEFEKKLEKISELN